MSLAQEKRKLIVAAKFAYRMASSSADLTCARCNEPLPSNDLLPGWPFGTILALDEVDRLLWAICERCEGWTLSPEGTALDLLDALGTWRERADASWLSPEVTELTTNGVRVLIRHEPRAHHAVPYADSPARRRRRVALVLWAVFIATYIGVQLLDVEPVWPYFAAFGLVVLVSLLQPHPKKGVQFESRDGRKFRLLPDAGAELRRLPDGGWQIEIGDATPSGAVRAFGRTRFLGSDALNAVQRLIAVSLADGARYPDIRVAQEILGTRGNPFLNADRGDGWPDAFAINTLTLPEKLALEIAATEALTDRQLRNRGRKLEEKFTAQLKLANIVRDEID